MIMNKISNDMLKTLLEGDMKKIAEKLTNSKMTSDPIIIQGDTEDLKKGWLSAYINIANFIEAHCTTSEVTDTMNRFLAKNEKHEYLSPFKYKDDTEYWNKFDKVCEILTLSPSKYIGADTTYTYNYDNDLSQDIEFRILEDDRGTYYALIEVHLGGDARCNFSDTVLLELNDVDYFYRMDISGWVRETEDSYETLSEILEDTVEIKDGCFYNEEGYEILLDSGLYY